MKGRIQISDLTIIFDDIPVIKNFTHEFCEGSRTAISGPSGIGKTSLLNAIMGLIPYEGTISFDSDYSISVVFQEDRLCEGMSVYRNIKMVNNHMSKADLSKELDSVGLSGCIDKKISKLSGGMKRRVAILRALIKDSSIILMDEPFKGMDDETKTKVIDYINKKASGRTMIFVTHDLTEADLLNSEILKF